ncbi:DUF2110 family protein [Candidatus Bathyarchaeota archaeon]|nr:DUF2110 family protein [Candidatus Bathyarchaeota archaeon]
MEILISEKINRKTQALNFFKALIRDLSKGLAVKINDVNEKNGFINLVVEGEDLEAFISFLKKTFGLAPSRIDDIKLNPIFKAFISRIENGIQLDTGIMHPKLVKVYIPIETLWTQLAYGKRERIETITTQYCLFKDFPLEVRAVRLKEDEVEAMLSDKQLQLFWEWQTLPFERVIIGDVLINEVKKAINLTNAKKEIIEIKSLSLFTHSLTCKLGLSSKLIAFKLQKQLPASRILSFTPKNFKVDC